MASITQTSEPEIPDNHRESWLVLLSAAEAYCQKSGCDLAILTACKKFRPSTGDAEGGKKREGGATFPRECDFSYSVWGQGFLAESARRYVDDIGVLHSTTVLTTQKHARQPAEGREAQLVADVTSDLEHRGVSDPSLSRLWSFILNLTFCSFFSAELHGRRRHGRSQPQRKAVLPKLPIHLQLWGRRGAGRGAERERREGAGEECPGSRTGEAEVWHRRSGGGV